MKAEFNMNGDLVLIPENSTEEYAVSQRLKDKTPFKMVWQIMFAVIQSTPGGGFDVKQTYKAGKKKDGAGA